MNEFYFHINFVLLVRSGSLIGIAKVQTVWSSLFVLNVFTVFEEAHLYISVIDIEVYLLSKCCCHLQLSVMHFPHTPHLPKSFMVQNVAPKIYTLPGPIPAHYTKD